jgi:hypothetical protein
MTAANPSSPLWDARMRGCLGQLATPKAQDRGVLTTPFPWVSKIGLEEKVALKYWFHFSSAAWRNQWSLRYSAQQLHCLEGGP